MTAKEFIQDLDEAEQIEKVWESVCVGDRQDEEHNILLYQVDGFYVEVFYNREHNIIKKFSTFENTEFLEPYFIK